MGYYVNPRDGTEKEQFLIENGLEITNPKWPPPLGMMFVCWVDNGPFTAAGIACSEPEFDVFKSEIRRPTRWYCVAREKLAEFLPERLRNEPTNT